MEKQHIQLQELKESFEGRGIAATIFTDSLPIPICITDKEGIFRQVNQAYCDFYGYSRTELIGSHFTIVVPTQYRAELIDIYEKFIQQKYEMVGEWDVQTRDGSIKKIIVSAAYLEDEFRTPFKVTFVADLSSSNKSDRDIQLAVDFMAEKAEATETAQAIMLHDIRKPIASILGISRLLESQDGKDDLELLKVIIELADSALQITDSYHKLQKMELGAFERENGEVNLAQLLQKVIKLLTSQPVFLRREIKYSVDAAKQSVMKGDQSLLSIMIENLLRNALEATAKDQMVEVVLKESEVYWLITVWNPGVIPLDIRVHFFEKYVTRGKAKGTGLGTYISRLIARQHGGDITFTSNESAGTELQVHLPKIN